MSEECLRFFAAIETLFILALGPALGLCGAAVTKCCPARSTSLCDGPRKNSGLSCVTYRTVPADGLDLSSGNHTPPFHPFYYLVKILMEYSFVFHLYLVGVVVWRHF